MARNDIAAIVVLYHPPARTLTMISALARDAAVVIAVINAAEDAVAAALAEIANVTIVRNERNVGLATALNQGLRIAFGMRTVEYALLLDQDSQPPPELPGALAQAFEAAAAAGHQPAAIGPTLQDMKLPDAAVGPRRQSREVVVPVPSLATSGTLLSRSAYDQVGPMLDALFIDCIDHEWCMRAQSLGLETMVLNSIVMLHDMGTAAINYRGTFKPLHRSPDRHYYIIRNSLYVARLPHVTGRWKVIEVAKTVRRAIFYVATSDRPFLSLRRVLKATTDAFASRMGPLEALDKIK